MTNVVIADDHRIVAEGIARLIEESKTASVVGITSTITDAVLLVSQLKPEILLLDIAMTDGDGIEAIPRFKQACPDLRVVILTCYAEPSVIHRAMQAGISGYLLKNINKEEFVTALNSIITGQTYICNEAKNLVSSKREAPPALTNREREILQLIVQGYTIKEIAAALFEDEPYDSKQQAYVQKIMSAMMKSLKKVGAQKAVNKSYNSLSVNVNTLDCDYYRFADLDAGAVNAYQCEYMSQYYWADFMFEDF